MKTLKIGTALAIAGFLAACGNGFRGTYSGYDDMVVKFVSDDKIEVTVEGQMAEGTYKKNGDTIFTNLNGNTNTFIINSEGCLVDYPAKFCKID